MIALWLSLLAHAAAPGWAPTEVKAVDAFNDGVDLLAQAAPERAEKVLKKGLKVEASGMLRQLYATSILRQNRADEAIALYAELALEYPDQVEVWAGYSEALFVGEEFDAAREAALRGLDLDPRSFNAQHGALQADLRSGDYEAAAARLSAFETTDEGLASCLWIRLALETEDEATALAKIPACEEADPLNAESVRMAMAARGWKWDEAGNTARAIGADRYADLSRIMDLLAQERLDEALAAANTAIETHGEDPGFRLLRGLVLIELGEASAGLVDLEAVFLSEDWVDAERGGTVSGIVTKKSKEAWDRNIVTAVAHAVGIYERMGQSKKADELIERTRERVGGAAVLEVARTELALARGAKQAWAPTLAVLDALDANAEARLGELLFAHGGAPEPVLAWAETEAGETALVNALGGAANRGEHAVCARLAEARATRFSATGDNDALGYRCAIAAGERPAAKTWLDRALASKAASSPLVQNHVVLLVDAEDYEGAHAVLEAGAAVLDPTVAAELGAFVALKREDLDAAATLAAVPGVKATTRYNVGVALYQAGRVDEADPIIRGACPELTGEAKGFCEEAVKALDGR